jgi:anti-sigma B factor antagonist
MPLQSEQPPLKEDRTGDMIVVHFIGSRRWLDDKTLLHIHDQLLALAEEPSEADLLLDLAAVEYVSARALGMLVSLHKKLLARGRHLTLDNLTPQVHEVFAVTKLNRFLNLRLAGQVVESAAEVGRSPRQREERWLEIPRQER